jgi:pimeloyl-ACP methyl ester carboxylesterase
MTDSPAPAFFTRPDGLRLAYHHRTGTGPTIIFLPGYMSDMEGSKAQALDAWAAHEGRAILRFDYSGCGASEGHFEDGTLTGWRDDVLLMIRQLTRGPLVLVGSSMGGWLMLLAALALPDRVVGLMGIAPAPDFTEWGFSDANKAILHTEGRLAEPSIYSIDPYITTLRFWESGQANHVLDAPIPIDCPVRLLHGLSDEEVPWDISVKLSEALTGKDVRVTLIKDGNHRLSRDQDIALFVAQLAEIA